MASVTPHEAEAWIDQMLDNGDLSRNSVRLRLVNVKTVIEWGRKQALGDLFPSSHPLGLVAPPGKESDVPQGERAYTLREARKVLLAARGKAKPERRWLPWLCAYSGARINEVAQLLPSDFRCADGVHYYQISTAGRRKLKNDASRRRLPRHPDLIKEGLLEFVETQRSKGDQRMFGLSQEACSRALAALLADGRIMRIGAGGYAIR